MREIFQMSTNVWKSEKNMKNTTTNINLTQHFTPKQITPRHTSLITQFYTEKTHLTTPHHTIPHPTTPHHTTPHHTTPHHTTPP